MNYMDEFEQELRRLLSAEDLEAVVRFAKERLRRSYFNGQASGGKPRGKRRGTTPQPTA